MPRVSLNARFCESVRPDSRLVEYCDAATPGLCLRVTPGGAKTWTLRYRPGGGRQCQQRRLRIGPFPAVSLAEARTAARDHVAAIAKGADPAAERDARRAGNDMQAFATMWVTSLRERGRHSSDTQQGILDRDVLPVIGRMKPADIRRAQVRQILDRVKARGVRTQANRTFEVVRALFRWIGREFDDVLDADPTFGMTKPFDEQPRDRLLTDDELHAVWHALKIRRKVMGRSRAGRRFSAEKALVTEPVQIALKLLILTGQRSSEVTQAQKSEFDLEAAVWTLPATRTKAGRRHTVPLSTQACDLAARATELAEGSPWIFPAPFTTRKRLGGPMSATACNHALARVLTVTEITDLRVHDFRRLVASGLARLGFGDDVIAAVLNHSPQGVTARHYNHHRYEVEKRRALEAWASCVDELVDDRKPVAHVVQLQPATVS